MLGDFGPIIRKIRKSRELTQEQMAEILGISLRYYQGLEQGQKGPSPEKFDQILLRLKMSPAQFFGSSSSKTSPTVGLSFASSVLKTLDEASPLRRGFALAVLFDDPSFLEEAPAGVSQALKAVVKQL